MQNFNVFGVPNSISVNLENAYIAVGYYDEKFITFHHIDNGKLLSKMNTEYCSAYSNLIKTNSKFFVYLHSAKTIKVLDSKSLKELFSFDLNNCGAVNSIELNNDKLFVFANSPIGDKTNKKDIFIYDLGLNQSDSFDSGIYIKKGTIIDQQIVIFGNYLGQDKKNVGCVRILELDKKIVEETVIYEDSSIDEVILYEVENKLKVKGLINSDHQLEGVEASLDNVEFGFDLMPSAQPNTVVGCVKSTKENELDNVIVITQQVNDKTYKMKISDNPEDVETLPFDVVTGATASKNNKFYFGVDKAISIVEL